MSTRPEGIPEDVWAECMARAAGLRNAVLWQSNSANEIIADQFARAILAAEKRGEERERERWKPAALYFELYCQDEADDVENCVCGEQQHENAKAFAAAIRQVPTTNEGE
jgi:hypothetical protein